MPKDIDQMIGRLEAEFPGACVKQLRVVHPGADDDGLWFIRIPGRIEEVQVESSDGNCPFLIESDFNTAPLCGSSVDEVVSIIRSLYIPESGGGYPSGVRAVQE